MHTFSLLQKIILETVSETLKSALLKFLLAWWSSWQCRHIHTVRETITSSMQHIHRRHAIKGTCVASTDRQTCPLMSSDKWEQNYAWILLYVLCTFICICILQFNIQYVEECSHVCLDGATKHPSDYDKQRMVRCVYCELFIFAIITYTSSGHVFWIFKAFLPALSTIHNRLRHSVLGK